MSCLTSPFELMALRDDLLAELVALDERRDTVEVQASRDARKAEAAEAAQLLAKVNAACGL